jgi:hypothetical protein
MFLERLEAGWTEEQNLSSSCRFHPFDVLKNPFLIGLGTDLFFDRLTADLLHVEVDSQLLEETAHASWSHRVRPITDVEYHGCFLTTEVNFPVSIVP